MVYNHIIMEDEEYQNMIDDIINEVDPSDDDDSLYRQVMQPDAAASPS